MLELLVVMRDALQGEGVASVLRDVAPGAQIGLCDKRNLLRHAEPARGALSAVVLAHPWISLTTLRALHRRQPGAVLVVLSAHADASTHRALLAASVTAIVDHDAPPDVVGAAVRLALCGGATVQGRALREPHSQSREAMHHSRRVDRLNLTARQLDVLRLIASNHRNQGIAGELGIGVRTVKGHVAVILRALHADNRRDAGRHARRWLARNDGAV